jgi:hypothetical protein
MRISVHFQFNDEPEPAASTGVEGTITDFILPSNGDLVRHRNVRGALVLGMVMQRIYVYDLTDGLDVDGTVTVTIMLEKVQVH